MSIIHRTTPRQLSNRRTAWLKPAGSDCDIVLTTKLRLARNLSGRNFPVKAKPQEFIEVRNELLNALDASDYSKTFSIYNVDNLSEIARFILLERRIISSKMAHSELKGLAAGVSGGEELSFMINEEDHFKVQSIVSGMNVSRAWRKLNKFIQDFNKIIEFSNSQELGWLTSSPKDVGTGLRISFFCHLPALTITDRLDKVFDKIISASISIQGIFGDGYPNHSNIFQISNQATLGLTEEEIMEKTELIVRQVIEAERKAKERLKRRSDLRARDIVGRSFYILKHARLLGVMEFISFISAIRLGIDLGWIKGIDYYRLNLILVKCLPGHLSIKFNKMPRLMELDRNRADFVRENLKYMELA